MTQGNKSELLKHFDPQNQHLKVNPNPQIKVSKNVKVRLSVLNDDF